MRGIVDTSSLVAVARYYLSIKDEAELLRFLEGQFRSGHLVMLNSVYREAAQVNSGIAIKLMKFLEENALHVNDETLTAPAPKKFSNQLDNNLCVPPQKRRLTQEQYIQQKAAYMASADAKLLLYALNHQEHNPLILTEETKYSNDGKLFKKLPAACDFLEIAHMSIAEWLTANGVTVVWSLPQVP